VTWYRLPHGGEDVVDQVDPGSGTSSASRATAAARPVRCFTMSIASTSIRVRSFTIADRSADSGREGMAGPPWSADSGAEHRLDGRAIRQVLPSLVHDLLPRKRVHLPANLRQHKARAR
jgi:hypothetical protein